MNTIRKTLFFIVGCISIIIQLFGEVFAALLLQIWLQNVLWPLLFLIFYYLAMWWKRRYYTKLGYKNTGMIRYEKPKE